MIQILQLCVNNGWKREAYLINQYYENGGSGRRIAVGRIENKIVAFVRFNDENKAPLKLRAFIKTTELGTINNSGNITTSGTGIYAYSGQVNNSNEININGGSDSIYGIKAEKNSNIVNTGSIIVNNTKDTTVAYGVYLDKSSLDNQNIIKVTTSIPAIAENTNCPPINRATATPV